jgi:hypothetical protein
MKASSRAITYRTGSHACAMTDSRLMVPESFELRSGSRQISTGKTDCRPFDLNATGVSPVGAQR